jgi:hypothetical protein
MPRAPARIRKRFVEGQTEVLDSEVEESFLFGRGCIGTALELRTLDDWRRLWSKWREVVMPKVIEHRPGTRPMACYVVGEIPARPVAIQPPMSHDHFKLYVPASNGTGQWHYDYPKPFMQDEAYYLRDLGVIDGDEFKRHLAWRRRGNRPSRSVWHFGSYVLEMGLHQ